MNGIRILSKLYRYTGVKREIEFKLKKLLIKKIINTHFKIIIIMRNIWHTHRTMGGLACNRGSYTKLIIIFKMPQK
jgi:hypothetical protein